VRSPDFTGKADWRAWHCAVQRTRPDHAASLGNWLLFCPGAHAFWSYWWVALIHLRPIEGVKPAIITTPGAGWEMACLAQDPQRDPDPDKPVDTFAPLTPIDWVVQFGYARNDREAERVAVVLACMTGEVSPDTDFASYWAKAIPDTAKHYSEGAHPQS
jgi:hypothetical protein